MASIKFYYRSTKEYAKLTARLRFSHNNKNYQYDAPTEIYVDKRFWDDLLSGKRFKEAEQLKKKQDIDAQMAGLNIRVIDAFSRENFINIDRDWYRNVVDEYFHPKSTETLPSDLLKYFSFFLEIKKTEIEESTYKRYRTVLKLLSRYYQENKIASLNIDSVNLEFQRNFEAYCRENKYSTNTIGKSIKVIKSVCKHAYLNGLSINPQLDSFKIKKEEVDSIYLDEEELFKIKQLGLRSDLDIARDWLLISCYSGQRISDFKNFKADNIKNLRGVEVIEIKQKKTKTPVIIPVHPELKEILKKRNGEFPLKMKDAYYNKLIKKVCELAEINELLSGKKKITLNGSQRSVQGVYPKYELITSHVGRKSFATNFYGKISTPLIMSATGHKTEQSFLMYIGKTQSDLSVELGKLFQ